MHIKPVEFSLEEMLGTLLNSLQHLAERKNIALKSDLMEDFPIVELDAVKLQQIVSNLLSNAIKFTPEGGRITVKAWTIPAGDRIGIMVEDTGIGIPLEDQERIFEKFRQGKNVTDSGNSMTREYEGTGLGLSIVKELCKLMSGEIHLESEFGKGSKFTVILPRAIKATEDNPDAVYEQTIERARQKIYLGQSVKM